MAFKTECFILQTAFSFVNDATKFEQLKACEQQEHQAMEFLVKQQKAKMDAPWESVAPAVKVGLMAKADSKYGTTKRLD